MLLPRGAVSISGLVLFAALMTLVAVPLMYSSADAAGLNTITSPDTAGNVGRHTSLALDASGNPVVSYFDHTNLRLKVLHCGDATCGSGNTIATPDPAPGNGEYTSLALDAAGNPVVSYWYGQLNNLRVLHCGDPDCGGGNSIATPDSANGVGQFTSLALDANGYPVVSYYDSTNNDLKVLHCGDPSCSSGNVITSPDTAGYVGLWTSLALDGSGNPVISYFDGTGLDLKVLHCGNPNCSAGNAITSPDTAGFVGQWTSLALDAGGNPVVSYFDQTNNDLKVLHCGNPVCSVGNVITSPDTGNVGIWSSLVLAAGGNPVISYYDAGDHDLKILNCGDPNCGAGNAIISPDTAGDVGTENSLVLDASANPVISYHDAFPNYDLKVLHCGDPTCTPDSDGDGINDMADLCPALPGVPEENGCPPPGPPLAVGGSVELLAGANPADDLGSHDAPDYTRYIAALVAGAILLCARGWYARTRQRD